jgi:hypothetical protein
MRIIKDPKGKASARIAGFPRFWPIHYFYFNSVEEAKANGLNMPLLKPRGTGFSELHSWIAASDFTFQKEDPSFFFVSNEGYLNKDGILTKCWDTIDFLSSETERAFRHLRQKKDTDLHKRASYIDPVQGVEKRTGGEIIGRVIDHPRKVRGARGNVFWEEGGSFPGLIDAFIATRALTEQGGVTFATNYLWGTGGEQGAGIQGLETIFRSPLAYKCLPHENQWEDVVSLTGFFFPAWACMDKFEDQWGNTDFKAAYEWHCQEREIIRKESPRDYDKHIAEYPFTPSEALMRLTGNHFPVSELQAQHRKITTSNDIKGIKKHGKLVSFEGKVEFKLDPFAKPIERYPHDRATSEEGKIDLEGCVTIVERPLTINDEVPSNLYDIVVDPFSVDDVEQVISLGAIYVYKKANSLFPTEGDMLVAWFVGRPARGIDFHRIVFNLAKFYNAKVHSEILGGGQNLLDFARQNNLLHYCAPRPTMFSTDRETTKRSHIVYFLNLSTEFKKQLLRELADWLLLERNLIVDDEKTQYVQNLEMIYDPGLLEELIKFNFTGNFDRISALLVLMAIRKEAEAQEIEVIERKEGGSIFDRPLFTDSYSNNDNILPLSEMMAPRNKEQIKPMPGGDLLF